MNIDKLFEQISGHYDNFANPTAFSDPGYDFPADINYPMGLTTKFIGHFLNFAISLMEDNEAHLHLGVYNGLSLAYAMTGNFDKTHYAADDFSFEPTGVSFYTWMHENKFLPHLFFKEGDCFKILTERPSFIQHKIAVYFYDADHKPESQLSALRLIEPFLADQAVIIVDDTTWEGTSMANKSWINENKNAFLVFDLPQWYNGIQVLGFRRT